jgi:gliding motility-associated-like protein
MKPILITLLFLSPIFSFGQVNLKNGLVACYPFNANVKDESGNGNNGIVNGATLTTDRFGKANSAYKFDGNSYISVSPNQFKNQSYSYATWVYLDNLPTNENEYALISVGWITSDQNLLVTTPSTNFNRIANGFSCWGYNTGSPPVSSNWTGTNPDKNKWYHLVSTRDNTSMKLYIDGILIADNSSKTITNGTTPIYSSNSYATIGGRQNSLNPTDYYELLKGSLDDIHIYNRAITADEVKALYDGNTAQTITISADNLIPCGGDKIIFTANGGTNTAKYQWKVDGVNAGTDSKTLTFNAPNISAQYQVKIAVEVTDDDPCFPKKSASAEQIFTIKNCVIPPVSTGVDLKNGLVACYPFNSNAKDESGNGNNGTVNGANLTTDRFGKANSAYKFDGNSYISVSPNQFKNQSYTYATWVKLDNLLTGGDNNCFITIGGAGGDQGIVVANNYSTVSANGFDVFGYNSGNPTVSGNWSATKPDVGKWYHVVGTRDNNSIKLYVDGQLIADNSTLTNTGGTTPNYAVPTYVTIGARHNGTIQFLQGSLDDIHIYNRSLTAAEVKALFDGESPTTITLTADKSAPCGGDKITFTTNGASATAKYKWKIDGVSAGTNSKTFIFNSLNNSINYQIQVSVEVTDEDVCFPKKPVLVDKIIAVKNCTFPTSNTGNKILIPTAFTPNGDGTNDVWELTTLAGNGDLIVEIYNRWGEIVFYSKGYSEPWNGTYKGSPVPEGTYAYVVRVDAEKVFRGAVLVVR